MQKVFLVARERIIKNAKTNEIHSDDFSLYALNGIEFGPVRFIPDQTDPLVFLEEFYQEFNELNPTFRANSYSIRLEDGSEIPC